MDYEGRLVTFTPMRERRQIRRIGLQEETIGRGDRGGFPNSTGFGKSCYSAKCQIEAKLQAFFRFPHATREAVYDTRQASRGPQIAKDGERVLPGIASVYYHGYLP